MNYSGTIKRRRWVMLIAAGSVSLLLAACSSSSSGGSTTNSSASGSGSIKIMALGLFQSAALSLPDSEAAMQAKVDAVNASGGIDGHQIDLTTCNDQLDPDQSAACARQAVSNGDVAVVASYEPYTAQVLPILESANIPFFNGEAIDNGDANSATEFPLTGGAITQSAAAGAGL